MYTHYRYNKEHQNSIGNYFGPYVTCSAVLGVRASNPKPDSSYNPLLLLLSLLVLFSSIVISIAITLYSDNEHTNSCPTLRYGWWTKSCMTLRTLNHGNCGIFLIMGNAGFCSSTVRLVHRKPRRPCPQSMRWGPRKPQKPPKLELLVVLLSGLEAIIL